MATRAHPPISNFQSFLEAIRARGGRELVLGHETRAVLRLVYDAYRFVAARPNVALLNLFASRDESGFREEIYRQLLAAARYEAVDFWGDRFIYRGTSLPDSHTLPFPDATFDVILTTKVLLEHVSRPEATMNEIARVLKTGGHAFLVASFIKMVHQQPYDFFRFTEYGLRHLATNAGLEVMYIKPTSSAFMTALAAQFRFNEFGLLGGSIQRRMHQLFTRVLLPVARVVDPYIRDQGRFTDHYLCRVRKV